MLNGDYKTTGGIPTARPVEQTKGLSAHRVLKTEQPIKIQQPEPKPIQLKEQSQPLCPEQSSMERRTQKGMRQSSRERNGKKSKRSPKATMPTEEKESRKCPGMNTVTRTTRWKQSKAKKSKERRLPSSISKILATDEGLDEVHTVHERAQATSGRTKDKPRRLEKGRGGQSKVEMTGEGPRKVGEKPRGL